MLLAGQLSVNGHNALGPVTIAIPRVFGCQQNPSTNIRSLFKVQTGSDYCDLIVKLAVNTRVISYCVNHPKMDLNTDFLYFFCRILGLIFSSSIITVWLFIAFQKVFWRVKIKRKYCTLVLTQRF